MGERTSEQQLADHLWSAVRAAKQCELDATAAGDSAWAEDLHRDVIALAHLAWSRAPGARFLGPPLPAAWSSASGVLHLRPDETPADLWAIVPAIGLLFQQEAGYSRNPFPSDQRQHHIACLWVADGRAAGALVYQEEEERFRWLDEVEAADNGDTTIYGDYVHALRIEGVWVARHCRQQGIAKSLALAAASDHGLDPKQLIHSPPFTPAGRRFAESVAGARIRVTTEAQNRWRGPLT